MATDFWKSSSDFSNPSFFLVSLLNSKRYILTKNQLKTYHKESNQSQIFWVCLWVPDIQTVDGRNHAPPACCLLNPLIKFGDILRISGRVHAGFLNHQQSRQISMFPGSNADCFEEEEWNTSALAHGVSWESTMIMVFFLRGDVGPCCCEDTPKLRKLHRF